MPSSPSDLTGHFAHCVQIFGGTTAASRRLGIDERALRRFINGERPVSPRLLQDAAQALPLFRVIHVFSLSRLKDFLTHGCCSQSQANRSLGISLLSTCRTPVVFAAMPSASLICSALSTTPRRVTTPPAASTLMSFKTMLLFWGALF